MIQVEINLNNFKRQMNKLTKSLDDLPSKRNMNNVTRAAGSIAAKKFVKDLNSAAKTNKKVYHHIYEWDKVGVNNSRLFTVLKSGADSNNITLSIRFNKSKTKVPIPKRLQRPGPNGKSVTRTTVFKNKAEAMESNSPLSFVARRNIAYTTTGRDIVFKRRGTFITIRRPGGDGTTGAVEKFANKWEKTMLRPAIVNSGIFENLSKDISKTMSKNNFDSSDIIKCIASVCEKYDYSRRDF
jgi:hypothetical protein